jgi:hypothetical protein
MLPDFPDRSATSSKTTGLFRVRSPLLAESLLMSFPPGTEMFQFPGFASTHYVFMCGSPCGGVAPFGYPRIKACSRLPMAFRSVPRPSSPPGAKASTECPSHTLYHFAPVVGCQPIGVRDNHRHRPIGGAHSPCTEASLDQGSVLSLQLSDITLTRGLYRYPIDLSVLHLLST